MTGFIPTLAQCDELHRAISPSQAAYDVIHAHCEVVATITQQLVRRQNDLYRQTHSGVDSLSSAENAAATAESSTGIVADVTMISPMDTDSPTALSTAFTGSKTSAQIRQFDSKLFDSTPRNDSNDDSWTLSAGAPAASNASYGIAGGKAPTRLLDEDTAVVGAMLHDIGTYRLLKHDGRDGNPIVFDGPRYILHGLLGYEWLLAQGVDESIAQFARNHTGVGLSKSDVVAQGLPLPEADYMPRTLEQEVVMVADKYNSKSVPPKFLTAEAYTRKAARFGESNKRRWLDLLDQYGIPDVPALAQRFGMRIKS